MNGLASSRAGRRRQVLVWGALGFVGRHLVTRLLNDGADVSVLCRPRILYPSPTWADRVNWFEVNDTSDAQPIFSAAIASASVIYDLAGSSGAAASNEQPLSSLDEICRSQLQFLTACGEATHQPHVVFPSSWLVYDRTKTAPIVEAHTVGPRSMYAAHKLCVEHYLRIFAAQDKITYTICRISNPYGFDSGRATKGYKVLNSFIHNALIGRPISIFGDGRQLRDFIHIADLVDALVRCGSVAEARNETFNIGNGQSVALIDAAQMIADLAGASAITFEPWPIGYRLVEPGDCVLSVCKAKTTLGVRPAYDLKAGLKETIAEYRDSIVAALQLVGP